MSLPSSQGVLNLPDKIHAMDVLGPAMVVATANKQLHVYNLMNPGTPTRSFPSPLKHQIRFVRIFHDMQFFGAVSVEGRCAIRCLDENMDKQQESVGVPHPFLPYMTVSFFRHLTSYSLFCRLVDN